MTYIIAHRGACHFAPENTLSAFRKAVTMRVDGIETDVQVTADQKMVIHHNYTVDGNCNATGKIADMTLEELKELDFGSYKGPEYVGERIATLDECLDATRSLKLVNIELKAQADQSIPYVEMVIDAVKAHDMVKQTVIFSFNHSLLARVKELCPEIRTGALTFAPGMHKNSFLMECVQYIPEKKSIGNISAEDIRLLLEKLNAKNKENRTNHTNITETFQNPETDISELLHSLAVLLPEGATCTDVLQLLERQENLVTYVKNLDFPVDYLHPEYHSVLMDETLISRLSKIGVGVSPYTPNDPKELRTLYQTGCYSIITNRPDMLLKMRQN